MHLRKKKGVHVRLKKPPNLPLPIRNNLKKKNKELKES